MLTIKQQQNTFFKKQYNIDHLQNVMDTWSIKQQIQSLLGHENHIQSSPQIPAKKIKKENQFFPVRASNPMRIADNLCLFVIVCGLHKSHKSSDNNLYIKSWPSFNFSIRTPTRQLGPLQWKSSLSRCNIMIERKIWNSSGDFKSCRELLEHAMRRVSTKWSIMRRNNRPLKDSP